MSKSKKSDYANEREIRIIKRMDTIPGVFDSPAEERKEQGKTFEYKGEILGIPARIKFTEDLKYYVGTPTKESLKKVYNELINRLIGSDQIRERSLAEIIGQK